LILEKPARTIAGTAAGSLPDISTDQNAARSASPALQFAQRIKTTLYRRRFILDFFSYSSGDKLNATMQRGSGSRFNRLLTWVLLFLTPARHWVSRQKRQKLFGKSGYGSKAKLSQS